MAEIGYELEWMKLTRSFTVKAVSGLTPDQLMKIPANFNNNILWHVGHLLLTQCTFFYGLTNQPSPLSESDAAAYKLLFDAGTSPKTWTNPPDVDAVLKQFGTIGDVIVADAAAGKFDGFKPVELFPGLTLNSVASTAVFQCIHEGMHYGTITAYTKLVS